MPISNPGKNLFAPVALAWTAFCASPSVAQMSALDILFLDSYFEIIIAEQELPGMAVAVTSGEEIVHLAGDGEAREGEPATPDTQCYIASVSTSFTALAIMQLVEAGAVDLDAPVVQYLPSFRTAREGHAEKVTVRHLLNQTSGLSYDG